MKRYQENGQKLDALLEQLAELQNLTQFRELTVATEPDEIRATIQRRSKTVDQIAADYQTARSDFDTAVSDYASATTATEEFAAVVAATEAQQAQIDEIVEFLVMTNDSL
jgi:hypothetical protein